MKKTIHTLFFMILSILAAHAQSISIYPNETRITNSSSSEPLSINMRSNYSGYLDFKRGNQYSAGIVNTSSPRQLRIGIAKTNNGVDNYQDIVIDSTSRKIGFGTNNPQSRLHIYSVNSNTDGDILLESNASPFIILKNKTITTEGIGWRSSNDNAIGYLYHSSSAKKMYWGFGASPNNIVIDSATNYVGIGQITPTAKIHSLNSRGNSLMNVKIEESSDSKSASIGLIDRFGGGILFGSTSGVEVGNSTGGWGYVRASAFNIMSDLAAKKEVNYLLANDYDEYISQIRNIKSATYRYNWETSLTRSTPHIGFIAQSLPPSVQSPMSEMPGITDQQELIGYNLADMAGLTIMGIKAVDARTQKLEETIKAQQVQIDALIKEIEKLKK